VVRLILSPQCPRQAGFLDAASDVRNARQATLGGNKKAGPEGTGFLFPARHWRGCTRTLTGS